MSVHPFAGLNPRPSPWGYNWTVDEIVVPAQQNQVTADHCSSSSPELPYQPMADQYANMPAALLSTLKREKKPFTYTPGGVNLSEVLNARLQKRMERKKKYSEERALEELPKFEAAPKQLIVMPTYNSPLDMYSMQNALEALEVQAELVASDKSLSAPTRSATLPRNHTFRFNEEKDMDPGRGVAQSKAFRVLQIITDTEEEPAAEKPRGQHRDEMRFTGIRESRAIPSKFFHTLQKITGTDNAEEEQEEEEQQPSRLCGASRPVQMERQAAAPRHPFPQQQQQQLNSVQRQQTVAAAPPPPPGHQQQQHHQPPPFGSAPALKRPAAFLPIKVTPGFRPVQLPRESNGPLRKPGHPAAGTDF